MLQDLAEDMSYREIIKKYAEYHLSLAWLSRAVSGGDLERMSGILPGTPVGEGYKVTVLFHKVFHNSPIWPRCSIKCSIMQNMDT